MFLRTQLVREWHLLCIGFHERLWEGCLCDEKRMEIYLKMVYHQNKLANIGLS